MRSRSGYKPLTKDETRLIEISLPVVAITVVSLPLGAFVFCVIWSVIYNFNDANSTHCNVNNYLPSISAAVGSHAPQKYVWRICIALHSTPRYIISFMYYHNYHRSLVILIFNFLEISSLIGLTFISSTENFRIHATCFSLFIVSQWIGMVLTCRSGHAKPKSKKSFLRLVNTISILLAFYFYARHNWYCEAGVYTMFALCEYVVVVTNIVFHFQAFYDFHNYKFSVMNTSIFSPQ